MLSVSGNARITSQRLSWRTHFSVPRRVSTRRFRGPEAASVGRSADAASKSACATFARRAT
jgi:hypothetical protein